MEKKKYKLNSRKAEPDDPIFHDSQSGVTGVTFRFPKRKFLTNVTPAPPDHAVYLDTSARTKAPPPKPKERPPLSVEEYKELEKQKKEALALYARYQDLTDVFGIYCLENWWMNIYAVCDQKELDSIVNSIKREMDRLVTMAK